MAVMQFVLTAVLAASHATAVQLFERPSDINLNVPAKCRAYLSRNITCSDFLITAQKAADGETVTGEAAGVYCSDPCVSSMKEFHDLVVTNCGETPYQFIINSTVYSTGKGVADGLLWAQKLVCTKDDSGYCLADVYSGTKDACSDCSLKQGATLQENDYGHGKLAEQDFKDLLSLCSADPSKYPYSYTSSPPTTTGGETTSTGTVTSTPPSATCAGTKYTVKSGDTCASIAKSQSISTDRLVEMNYLDYNCDTLTEGMQLCIKDTCKITAIQKNQTCSDLLTGTSASVVQLVSWNPTLKNICDERLTSNLDAMEGRFICIGAPGQYVFPTGELTLQPTATLDKTMFSSWTTGEVITSPTDSIVSVTSNFPPTWTPPSQTIGFNKTQKEIEDDYLQYCWITPEDYDFGFNIDDQVGACQTLYWKYCFYDASQPSPSPLTRAPAVCTPDRTGYDHNTDPEPVETPTPTQPGMIGGCVKFYFVKTGDNCQAISASQNVSLDDFYKWNPTVGSDCRSLQLGVYVCVGYDSRLDFPTQTPAPEVRRGWF